MNYVSTIKAINGNWSNQKPYLALKTKMIIIKKIQIDQNTMIKNGQSSVQLFLKKMATQ